MSSREADSKSNAVRRLAWSAGSLLVLAKIGLVAQLPPDALANRYWLQAESAIEDQDHAGASAALERVLELQAQHNLRAYFHGDPVPDRSNDPEMALEGLRRYLERAGHKGESHMATLKLLDGLEGEIEQLSHAERERLERLEKERSERLERERLDKVAAMRKRWSTDLPPEIKAMEFVRIPAGRFQMGEFSARAWREEWPVTQVWISRPFEIGKHEVTQSEWTATMGSNPSSVVCGRCPVENVSWNDVQEFIGILNQSVAQDIPYRLPTEAEWEYAARAGTTGGYYSPYLGAIAWFSRNSELRPHPVGRKQANAFGLHDMLGNVAEWVQDGFQYYPGGSVRDPLGPSAGSGRVARSCGWGGHFVQCRASFRIQYGSSKRRGGVGFRLARDSGAAR